MNTLDIRAFRAINNLVGRSSKLDALGVFCSRWLIILLFASVPMAAAVRPGHAVGLMTAGFYGVVAAGLALLGDWLFSRAFFRQRPYVALKDVRRVASNPITSYSFPSSHASAAFALAFTLLPAYPQHGAVLLGGAVAVSVGRVFAGVHYPLDVLGGAAVGLFWAFVTTAYLIP